MDCIVLVGNRENYRVVAEENNKAFLEIKGRTILHIMMEELRKVEAIDRLLMVGPEVRLRQHLDEIYGDTYPKPVLVFEQKNDLVANVMAVLAATENDFGPDRYVLVLPSDIPLLIAEEVNQFIAASDMERYDYVCGVTSGSALERFYATEDKPGVKMTYMHLEGRRFRISNMHMARPASIGRLQFISKIYAMRYQLEWVNILGMLRVLAGLTLKNPGMIFFYLMIQAANRLRKGRFVRLSGMLEKLLTVKRAEYYASAILKTRFRMGVVNYGGSAIDVDNEADYEAICQRFDEWLLMQRKL